MTANLVRHPEGRYAVPVDSAGHVTCEMPKGEDKTESRKGKDDSKEQKGKA
jgi:hypothetical protein